MGTTMKRKTFAVVHNIPSPYRIHLFSAIHRELEKRNIDFMVHFFSHGHRERPGAWKNIDIPLPHKFWRDYGIPQGGRKIHFNPGLISHLAANRPDFLLVGGPWDTPSGFLSSLLAAQTTGIAWVEGNTTTPGRCTGPIASYKRFMLNKHRYVAVPGLEGEKYLDLLFGKHECKRPQNVLLPNIVEESKFRLDPVKKSRARLATRKSLGITDHDRLALWPARLNPVKGVLEFVSNLDSRILNGWKILIVGEGALLQELSRIIEEKKLTDALIIKSYIPYDNMPELYAASDLFMLASMQDPNPLSVVEAMHSGLPLLLSRRVGNFPEALVEKITGWGFDPTDSNSVIEAASLAFSASLPELNRMGAASGERAQEFWSTSTVVQKFLDRVGAV